MTVGELVFVVSRGLGLSDSVASGSNDELKLMQRWANQSVVDILLKTHYRVSWITQNLVAGTSEYTLPTTLLAIDNGKGTTALGIGQYVLVGMEEMISFQESGLSYSSRPLIAIDGDLLTVSPTPTAADTLRFLAVTRPTPLVATGNLGTTTDDSHDPSNITYGGIPSEFERAHEYYMLWRAAEYDDKTTRGYDRGPAQSYLDRYNDELKLIRNARRRRRGRVAIPTRVGYPPRAAATGRNDIYP